MPETRPLVLHVDTAPTWRGGQAQVLALLEGLARRGVAQALAAPRGPLRERAAVLGIAVHDFAPFGDLDLSAALGLAGLARRLRPRVLHLHSARAHATGWWAARVSRAASIVARRVDFDVATGPLSRLKYGLPVDRFVAVSGAIRDVLVRCGVAPARVTVIHSGIDVGAVEGSVRCARAEGRPQAITRALGLPEGAPLVGVIAALAPHKDHENLLLAAQRVRASHPAARFVCAGDGPLASVLRRRVEELGLGGTVLLPGFVEDVPALLGALDVFVLPSYLEGLGTSVLDAQAAGVPVVATHVGGIPEMVEDGRTGLLVPPRDPEALARAIGEALDDPAAARARADAARAAVRAFDVARMVERTAALYEQVTKETA